MHCFIEHILEQQRKHTVFQEAGFVNFVSQALSTSPLRNALQFTVNGPRLNALMGPGKYRGILNLNPETLQQIL